MIHCDEVFDILTRGPFPTGAASDGIVESHLHRCSECRRLAEALRPAIELFQEAVTPEESHGLPSYWGDFHDGETMPYGEFDEPVEPLRVARRQAPRRQHGLRMRRFTQAASWAAAVLVGIALARWSPLPTAPDAPLTGLTKAKRLTKAEWRLEKTPREWVAQHPLNAACYQPPAEGRLFAASPNGGGPSDPLHLACCKGCHGDTAPGAKGRVAAKDLLAACVACHQF